jgi:hypothetical protein
MGVTVCRSVSPELQLFILEAAEGAVLERAQPAVLVAAEMGGSLMAPTMVWMRQQILVAVAVQVVVLVRKYQATVALVLSSSAMRTRSKIFRSVQACSTVTAVEQLRPAPAHG